MAAAQVVVLPYISFVLQSNSSGTSARVPSAVGRPTKWRAAIKLSVHNMLPIEITVSLSSNLDTLQSL